MPVNTRDNVMKLAILAGLVQVPYHQTVYCNITICDMTNSTTLNGNMFLVILREPPLLKKIK